MNLGSFGDVNLALAAVENCGPKGSRFHGGKNNFCMDFCQQLSEMDISAALGGVFSLVCSAGMVTDRQMRARAAALVDAGLNQKAIAKRLGVSAPVFNKWLNQKRNKALDTHAFDKMNVFLQELADLVATLRDPNFSGEVQAADKIRRHAR